MKIKKRLGDGELEVVNGGQMSYDIYEYFFEGIDNADNLSGQQKLIAKNKLKQMRENIDRSYEDISDIFITLGLEM